MSLLLCCILAYLLGTINPAAFLARKKRHDLTESGTGNLGATNTMLAFGLRYGIFVLAFDLIKAFTAVQIAKWLFPRSAATPLLAGCCAVVGHIYPFQLRFRGGKGSACFAGVVLASQPLLFPVLLVLGIGLGLLIDYAFVVPVSAALVFPFMAAYRTRSLTVFCAAMFMGVLVIYKHKENFLAVRQGTEGHFRTYFQEKLRNRKNARS